MTSTAQPLQPPNPSTSSQSKWTTTTPSSSTTTTNLDHPDRAVVGQRPGQNHNNPPSRLVSSTNNNKNNRTTPETIGVRYNALAGTTTSTKAESGDFYMGGGGSSTGESRPRLDVPLQSSRRHYNYPFVKGVSPVTKETSEMRTSDNVVVGSFLSSEKIVSSESKRPIPPITAVSQVPKPLSSKRTLREADSTGSEGEILSDTEELTTTPSSPIPPSPPQPVVVVAVEKQQQGTSTTTTTNRLIETKKLESSSLDLYAASSSDPNFYLKPIFDSKTQSYIDYAVPIQQQKDRQKSTISLFDRTDLMMSTTKTTESTNTWR